MNGYRLQSVNQKQVHWTKNSQAVAIKEIHKQHDFLFIAPYVFGVVLQFQCESDFTYATHVLKEVICPYRRSNHEKSFRLL